MGQEAQCLLAVFPSMMTCLLCGFRLQITLLRLDLDQPGLWGQAVFYSDFGYTPFPHRSIGIMSVARNRILTELSLLQTLQ
jgi:hypothetical protein